MDTSRNNNASQALIIGDEVQAFEVRPEAQDPCTFPLLPAGSRSPSISVNPRHQVRFRHPHYPNSSNVLITLFAPDGSTGGIEYGVAHAACGVISGNRWNGWFTTTVEGAASSLTYSDILCERDYYFHLPESSLETPYAIVPTFKHWTFPHENLHPCWHINRDHIPLAQSRFAAPSSLSAAVYSRDQSCRMSGFTEGTQAAHLCPGSEEAWFQRNEMSRYNLNPLLVATGPMEDTANALLLRQDLHTHFDAHKFVFVPKKIAGEEEMPVVTHMLIASRELGSLHHNVRLKAIPDVDMAFLFTRFAWTIFTLLAGFLKVGVDRTLIGTTMTTPSGLPQIFSGTDCKKLLPVSKSRSQSPAKRVRRSSDTGIEVEGDESGRQYKRPKKDVSIVENTSRDASQSIEEPDNPATPKHAEDPRVLRDVWLKIERVRSATGKAWLEEATWAQQIRSNDKVMGPAESLRLYEFFGHEVRGCPEDDNDAIG